MVGTLGTGPAADALPTDPFLFLGPGGEMNALIRAFDWATTSIGEAAGWPSSLRTATALLLRSPVPIVMLWGEDGIMIYNDAYSVFAGRRHPELLGSKVREGWVEVAAFNDNVMRVVLAGETLAYREQALTLHRGGTPEQVWMNLDYSPVLDDQGRPAGVICILADITGEVLARHRVAREHERLQKLFEQAPTFMAMLRGEEHVFELINPVYSTLIGHRDVIGKTVAEALPEIAGQGFSELLDQCYRTGEAIGRWSEKMLLNRQADSGPEERYLDFVYQPIKDDKGSVTHIFVQGSDVTERVLAENRQRLLVNELNHRVKNTLTSVQAITSQTLRGALSLKEASDSINGRILALSRAHNLLTAGNWEGADIRDVLSTSLLTFDSDGRSRFDIRCDPLRLEPHAALSIALALYELGVNATNFGALSRAGGRVSLDCRVVAVDAGDTFRLHWQESGGPGVHAPSRRGFGFHLLERALPAELSGTVTVNYDASGLVFELKAPLIAVRATGMSR